MENSNLRQELQDNSNHLTKLETEASNMKVRAAGGAAIGGSPLHKVSSQEGFYFSFFPLLGFVRGSGSNSGFLRRPGDNFVELI